MLVYDNPGTEAAMTERLNAAGLAAAASCRDTDDLVAAATMAAADVVVVGAQAPSRRLLSRIAALQAQAPRPVALVAECRASERIHAAVAAGVNALVPTGIPGDALEVVVDLAVAQFQRLDGVARERDNALTALAERKIIERAKGIVMRQRGLDEDAAYRFMREAAMNRNMKLGHLATSIVDAEELLN